MRDELTRSLQGAGHPLIAIPSPDGAEILVLPRGGRIIGLFAPGSGENFLWTHPALLDPEAGRALLAGEAWPNSGGDRTWLAPEIDFFLPDYPALSRYVQPRSLDPGEYTIEPRPSGCVLSTTVDTVLSRSAQRVSIRIEKIVRPAPNPLRYACEAAGLEGLRYAGYSLRTRVRVLGNEGPAPAIGAWSLLQLPHGGELIVATYRPTEPAIVFGSIPADDLHVEQGAVRWRMHRPGEHKISFRAAAVTGRAAYVYASGEESSLVLRNFLVDPSGEYVDPPWKAPEDLGWAVQACSVQSGLGSFSELEHHAPATSPSNPEPSEDLSSVWAFRGSEEAVRLACLRLLGHAPEPRPRGPRGDSKPVRTPGKEAAPIRVVVLDTGYESYVQEEETLRGIGARLELFPGDRHDREGKIAFARGAQGAFVRWSVVDDSFLDALPELRAVVRYGVGYDNVDLSAATRHGVRVANVQGYANHSVSDHALALILACIRGLRVGLRTDFLRERFGSAPWPEVPELKDLTLGILGLGRIGGTLALKTKGLFRRILAHDPYIPLSRFAALGATSSSLEDLLSRSDVVSLHSNLTDETRGLLCERTLGLLRPQAVLINTSRGPVVDEEALLRALESGKLQAAGLDCFEDEPPLSNRDALLAHPRVVATGHYAWYSVPASRELQRHGGENMAALLEGRIPEDGLNP